MPETPSAKVAAQSNRWLLETAIAVATAPTVIALVGAKLLADAAQEMGQWSEEVFRGDRLPILNIPPDSTRDL